MALLEVVLPMPLRFWTMTVDPGSLPAALLMALLGLVLPMPLPGMLPLALLLLGLAGHRKVTSFGLALPIPLCCWTMTMDPGILPSAPLVVLLGLDWKIWKVTSFPPGPLCQEMVLPVSLLVALLEVVMPMLPSALLVALPGVVAPLPLLGMLPLALLLLWLAGHWKVTYFPPGRLCQEMVLPVSLLVALFELVLPMPLCCWLDPGIPPSALLVALLGLVPMPLPGTVPLALLLLQLARHWKAASFLPPKPWPLRQALVLPVSLLVAVLELVLPMPLQRCWAMKVDPGMLSFALLVALLELVVPKGVVGDW